jgi:hypothetical protein
MTDLIVIVIIGWVTIRVVHLLGQLWSVANAESPRQIAAAAG